MKEKRKSRLHPVLVFLILIVIVMVISGIGDFLNLETSYYTVDQVTGQLESQLVTIESLFNRTGIQYILSNMISNFINFAPLGTLITGLLGVGVAYKSGFLTSLFKLIKEKRSRKFITYVVVLLGIITSMFYDMGFVVLVPISAILFKCLGRHPIAGVCAAFSGIAFGYGANFVVNGLDASLIEYTKTATNILDSNYIVNINGNLIFMIVSSLLLSFLGMYITEKYIVPKLGKYVSEDEIDEYDSVSSREKKGLILSIGAVLILSIIIIYCIIPGLPFSGLLLYLKESTYVNQLFGSSSYFSQGVVFIFSFLLGIAGLIYGFRLKTFKTNKDFVEGMNYYLSNLSSILVLIFFAAQFCAIFKKSNIGVFVTSSLAEAMSHIEITGSPLIIVTFLIVIISGIFVPVASTKWAILSPVIVPMFMQSSMTPEFAVAVFRAGDSAIRGMTPLFTYFVILIGFIQIYQSKKEPVTITDTLTLMMPYFIGFTVLWLVIILAFYIIGIPLGLGVHAIL